MPGIEKALNPQATSPVNSPVGRDLTQLGSEVKRFREIFDLHDVNPPAYPFKEVLNRMSDKMKNGDAWLEYSQDNINHNNDSSKLVIDHVNGIQYECTAEPLIDDDGHSWGRICMVMEIGGPQKKRKKTTEKKKTGKK